MDHSGYASKTGCGGGVVLSSQPVGHEAAQQVAKHVLKASPFGVVQP
jgi:hypothetical protein